MGVLEPLLTTQEFAAISAAGFRSLGPVWSRTVVLLDYLDRQAQCSSRQRGSQETDLAAAVGGSFYAMLRQRHQARELALERMVSECRDRGGDWIVGLKLDISLFGDGRTAFTMRGIAIRARAAVRPAVPFTTHVPGQALASLLQLVKDTRRHARTRLGHAAGDLGAEGVLVDEVAVRVTERECPKLPGEHDQVAEAALAGTAIVSAGRPPESGRKAPLTIMRLIPSSPVKPDLRPRFL